MEEYNLVTIKDILNEFSTIKKEKYRKVFENKKETMGSAKLESIVNKNLPSLGGKVYQNSINSSDAGERYGIATIDISVDEYSGMHGLTYKSAYQIVDLKSEKILSSFGPATYRGGHANDSDNWSIYFTESKILEEKKDSVIVGLKSREGLKVIECKKDGSTETIERYNLKSEEKEKRKLESVEKAIKDLDIDSIQSLMNAKYNFGIGDLATKKLSDDLVFVKINNLDRSYDAKINSIETYLVIKGKGIIKLERINFNTYHPGKKFSTVYPRTRGFEFKQDGNKIIISGKYEAHAKMNDGISRYDYGVQDTKEFNYKIDLSKLK